jgi:hypothetical protein
MVQPRIAIRCSQGVERFWAALGAGGSEWPPSWNPTAETGPPTRTPPLAIPQQADS